MLPACKLMEHHKKKIDFLLVVYSFETLDDAITISEQRFFKRHIDNGTNDIVKEFLLYVEGIARNKSKPPKEQKIRHILNLGNMFIHDWHYVDARKLLLEYVSELIIADMNEEDIQEKLESIQHFTETYSSWDKWHEKAASFVKHKSSKAA